MENNWTLKQNRKQQSLVLTFNLELVFKTERSKPNGIGDANRAEEQTK